MADSDKWRREEFGPYTLLECLGIGGMATVHRAVHRESGTELAIKRLLPQLAADQTLLKQFVREAEILQALAHPNIVKLLEHGRVDGVYFLAMERIEGRSILALLRQASEDAQPGPVGVSMWILHQILSALDHAMNALGADGQPLHIVHRDLSPSNVIVTDGGEIKVIDFGVAKGLQGRYATYSGRIKGKLGYMSPEVLTGRRVDSRSDVYSAAILGWELLTAQRLFRGSEREQLALRASNRERTPPSRYNAWVSDGLDDLLAKALAENPDERWSSHREMLDALEPLMQREGEGASTDALLAWMASLSTSEGVSDSAKTLYRERAPVAPSEPKSPARRFAEDVSTVVDPVFDPDQRHRATHLSGDSESLDPITTPADSGAEDPVTLDTGADPDSSS